MSVKVRPVAETEREDWERLFRAYAGFYKATVPEGGLDRVWAWIFDPDEEFWCDVAATADGQLIGLVQYQLMYRSLSGGKVCYLSDLYVDPALRGGGAGRALIDNVIEIVREKGVQNVRWLTQEFNYGARRLYDTYQPKSDFILYSIPV